MDGVELRPHIAKRIKSSLGEFVEEFDQWMLYLDGQHIGYVPKRRGAHISLVRRFPEEMQQAIKAEVEKLTGHERSRVSQPSIVQDHESDGADE